MASGVYAKVDISSANTWITAVGPAASGVKVTTLNLANRTGADIKIRVALAANTTVTDSDVIEYDTTIPANGVIERTGIIVDTTNGIQVYATATGVTAVAWGIDS